jgi:hypothetical protein
MQTEPSSVPASSNRSLILIAGAVVALAAVTILVVLLVGRDRTATYGADTPEGTVQRYLAAFEAGDLATAHGFFSSRVTAGMDLDAYRRNVDLQGQSYANPRASRRVLFERTTGSGDVVTVSLTVEEFSGDGLNGSTYRSSRDIRLVRQNGAWRIDEPLVWLDPAPMPMLP